MTANKLKEMIDKAAADALLNTDACVVTYSRSAGIELWSTLRPSQANSPAILATLMLGDLYMSSGDWCSHRGSTLIPITQDAHFDRDVVMIYSDFIEFIKSKEAPIDNAVEMMIQNIKGLPAPAPVDPKYVIHEQFYIDHQTFESKDEAIIHQKTLQIFDEFQKVDTQEFDVFVDVINDMIKNPEKYIKILQGK